MASPEWTVERHLEAGSDDGRALWHRFADLVAACGEHSLSVAKTTVTFKGPKRGFAGARPKGASPESITTIGVYGFRACAKRRIAE